MDVLLIMSFCIVDEDAETSAQMVDAQVDTLDSKLEISFVMSLGVDDVCDHTASSLSQTRVLFSWTSFCTCHTLVDRFLTSAESVDIHDVNAHGFCSF